MQIQGAQIIPKESNQADIEGIQLTALLSPWLEHICIRTEWTQQQQLLILITHRKYDRMILQKEYVQNKSSCF